MRERATLINRVQKVLEGCNIKLASVATDVMGVSGRAILEGIVAGEDDTAVLAELARGKMRKKRGELIKALEGRVRPHHHFLLSELLSQVDSISATIERFDEEIGRACARDEELVELLNTIPGVGREMAELILAEMGAEISIFRRYPCCGHGISC